MQSSVLCVVALCALALANGQSISSCGTASDKLQNATFTVSPDPIDKSKPLTITATGNLIEELGAGKFDVDLQVKALGIINEPVKTSAPFTVAPGLPTGQQKFVIGPFSLPSIPGSVDVTGQITASDSSGAQVFCLKLELNLGNAEQNAVEAPKALALPAVQKVNDGPVTDCSGANDHMHNRTFSDTGGVISFEGDLDENINTGEVDVDLAVKVLFIKIPIKLTIPFSIQPGALKGHLKFTAGPSSTQAVQVSRPEISVTVKGTVKVNDANKEEVVCLNVDQE